ncbi:hypothetical protein AC579_9167 [Pseudocercospora musae]|uniref:Uncharacterized protein n=1 Tax=Pseudocercospora musae TaxID=113226 RepID=A0A139GT39_9PEZI|nr:hypothetical protein AC579_9167 [Pseudocercospora musae]
MTENIQKHESVSNTCDVSSVHKAGAYHILTAEESHQADAILQQDSGSSKEDSLAYSERWREIRRGQTN